MSKKRMVDSNFWSDTWIDTLTRDQRHLFLYLLTNNKTTIAGVYEIPLKMIAYEADFEKTEVIHMLEDMKTRVRYINGWVILRNGIKNQNYRNEKIRRGIEIILEELPDEFMEFINIPKDFSFKPIIKPRQSPLFDETSISHNETLHSNSNSNSNSNVRTKPDLDALHERERADRKRQRGDPPRSKP